MPNTNTEEFATAPLVIGSAAELQWDDESDVVIAGFGGAGACTALAAVESGAEVIALDRFGGGGATALSGGVVYGGGTPYQKAAGLDDSSEEMYKYLKYEIGDVVRDETLRKFCNESNENLAWLKSHGVKFSSTLFEGKCSYPPPGFDLYYSGNESSPLSMPIAKPAARGHRVVGQGYTGNEFFKPLSDSAHVKGVKLMRHSLVNRLVVDRDGAVLGIESMRFSEHSKALKMHKKLINKVNRFDRFLLKKALHTGKKISQLENTSTQPHYIRARKGVVLTTGSFTFNRDMVRHYAPKYIEGMGLGTTGCNGDGIKMGLGLGAKLDYMNSVTSWRSISPPASFVKSIVVNKMGKRFIAEDMYLGHLGHAIAEQDEQIAWLIIDSHTYWHAFKETLPQIRGENYFYFRGPLLVNLLFNKIRATTLEGLAKKIGVHPDVLTSEVKNYNQGVAIGTDAFQKRATNQRAIGKGSFYALNVSTGNKKFPCGNIPMGGLAVDEDTGQVLREDNTPITGLYAAGRGAVGLPSGFYISGMALADCVFSGRRAGQAIAKS
jgi:3-oxo-5alpha-steroid 4-dehydrogenase